MGGHLRVAREVGSYKAAGYTPKSVNPLFSLQAGGANENKLRYAPYAMHKASLVRKKETPLRSFARCDARPRLRALDGRKLL